MDSLFLCLNQPKEGGQGVTSPNAPALASNGNGNGARSRRGGMPRRARPERDNAPRPARARAARRLRRLALNWRHGIAHPRPAQFPPFPRPGDEGVELFGDAAYYFCAITMRCVHAQEILPVCIQRHVEPLSITAGGAAPRCPLLSVAVPPHQTPVSSFRRRMRFRGVRASRPRSRGPPREFWRPARCRPPHRERRSPPAPLR